MIVNLWYHAAGKNQTTATTTATTPDYPSPSYFTSTQAETDNRTPYTGNEILIIKEGTM